MSGWTLFEVWVEGSDEVSDDFVFDLIACAVHDHYLSETAHVMVTRNHPAPEWAVVTDGQEAGS